MYIIISYITKILSSENSRVSFIFFKQLLISNAYKYTTCIKAYSEVKCTHTVHTLIMYK